MRLNLRAFSDADLRAFLELLRGTGAMPNERRAAEDELARRNRVRRGKVAA